MKVRKATISMDAESGMWMAAGPRESTGAAVAAGGGLISVVLPVYNEKDNIQECLRKLYAALREQPHELLVCYDFDADTTLPAIEAMADRPPTVRLVKNTLGRGVAHAMQAGFDAAKGDVVVTSMADLSDPPEVILRMAERIRRGGAHVVSGSRYMRGGSQTGGPLVKRTLSRLAGLSLYYFAGMTTHDATTNFRAYSAEFLRRHKVKSTMGFEVALELTAQAYRGGWKIDEVPSSWRDRSAGESRFKLWKWMPRYLYWFLTALIAPLAVWGMFAAMTLACVMLVRSYGANWPVWDEWAPIPAVVGQQPMSWAWLWQPHAEHRIVLPRLIYLAVLRLSHYDFRAMMYVNVGFLAAAAYVLIIGIRKARGRMSISDAFLPLAVLSLSQYQNLLWAFQVQFTVSAFLLALIVASALALRHAWQTRYFLTIGICTLLLPLCGGQGLALAPPLILWLGFMGLYRFFDRKGDGRHDGTLLLACALGTVLIILGYLHDLPTSAGVAALKDAHDNGQTFLYLAHNVLPGIKAFLSTAFLPDAQVEQPTSIMDHLYYWKTWSFVALGLLLATFALLTYSYGRFKSHRLRISAIAACFWSFVLLTLSLGIGRGMYGPQDVTPSRYATLAIPLLYLTYVSFSLYGGRILRFAVPVLLAAISIGLMFNSPVRVHGWPALPGTVGRALADGQRHRADYTSFRNDVARGDTVEELAAHHGLAITIHDHRYIPEYLTLMHDYRIGPYRKFKGAPPALTHIPAAELQELDVPVNIIQSNDMTFEKPNGPAHCNPGDPYFTISLVKENTNEPQATPTLYVVGVRLTFSITPEAPVAEIPMRVWWMDYPRNGCEEYHRYLWWRLSPDRDHTETFWVYDHINHLRIDPKVAPSEFELKKVTLLLKR